MNDIATWIRLEFIRRAICDLKAAQGERCVPQTRAARTICGGTLLQPAHYLEPRTENLEGVPVSTTSTRPSSAAPNHDKSQAVVTYALVACTPGMFRWGVSGVTAWNDESCRWSAEPSVYGPPECTQRITRSSDRRHKAEFIAWQRATRTFQAPRSDSHSFRP
jgi:hypothetical protein